MVSFDRIDNPTLRGRIAGRIRTAILEGALEPGTKLVERQLAAQFATSLTAVREALIVLEADGFVTKRPNAATHVTQLDWEDTRKLFDIRRVLERYAVELAARKCLPEHATALDQAYAALLEAIKVNDVDRSRAEFDTALNDWLVNLRIELFGREAP